ncbi:unnamed protein product, partial [Musa acuminata var. zebrina]
AVAGRGGSQSDTSGNGEPLIPSRQSGIVGSFPPPIGRPEARLEGCPVGDRGRASSEEGKGHHLQRS